MTMKIEEKDFAMAEEIVSQPATKTEEEKRKSMENLIEKAKKGNLSVQDLDEAIEEVDFESVLFGEDISQTKYFNYCPAIISETENGKEVMHVWFCTNKDDGVIMDHIGYRKGVKQDNGKWIFSDCDDAAIAYGCLQSGSAMLVNLAPGGNGKYTLIAAPVEMTEDKDEALEEMRGWFVPQGNMDIAEFLEQYSRLGGTHHLVLSYEINVEILQQFAELMNWDFKLIKA